MEVGQPEVSTQQPQRSLNICALTEELVLVLHWLGERICVTQSSPLLAFLLGTLPAMLLASVDADSIYYLSSQSHLLSCSSLVISTLDTLTLKPLLTPTVQKVLIVKDSFSGDINVTNMEGRRALVATCNSSDFFVKTEFESRLRHVAQGNLRKNLPGDLISRNRTVVIGTFNCTIFSATGPIRNGKPDWIDGVELQGVTALLESCGYNWSIFPSNGFGQVYPDGSLEEGMLRWLLTEGEVDIGFCDYWHTSGVVADVLNPWHQACTRLLVPRPSQVYHNWHSIFHPLPLEFWALALLSVLLSACTITSVSSVYSSMPWRQRPKGKTSFGDGCFEAFSLLIQGMSNHLRLYREMRVIQASWALFCVILGAAYSSSLASILTTPLVEDVPQTLVELIDKNFVWVSGIKPLTNPEFAFKTQSGKDEIWLKSQVSIDSMPPGKTAVLGEELGNIFVMGEVDAFSEEFLHRLMVSKECLAANPISIITRKMSSYFEFMSDGFSRLAETGILKKMLSDGLKSPKINKYVVPTASIQQEQILGGVPLAIAQLRGAFYILLAGQILALIAFLFEARYFSVKKIQRKKILNKKDYY